MLLQPLKWIKLATAASSRLTMSSSAILSSQPLPVAGPFPTMDPFLFCVYHKDVYPPATNDFMTAPVRGDGSDFNPNAPYRMYHGDTIPGFPQHPHRGFETITATITGLVDHADSVGNAGRYGHGDVQWMTAGGGVVHSEMFPLLEKEKPNALRFFQIWLNLPAKSKMVDPSFAMFWAHDVHKYESMERQAKVTVWAGNYFGVNVETQNSPPPDSWASDPANDVAVLHISIQPGGSLTLPKSNVDSISRSLFLIEGKGAIVDGTKVPTKYVVTLDSNQEVELGVSDSADDPSEFLLLQGKPIAEPVAKYGPFVMNTEAEIQQAFADYRRTQFGGWPWPKDDYVFARDKGRFSLLNGKETVPPAIEEQCDAKDEDTK